MTPLETLEWYRKHGLPENFCAVPFSTLIFEANGNICMCRRKGAEFAIGDARTQTWQEAWNGPDLVRIREEFLSGQVKTCAIEVRRDKCNLEADNTDFLKHIELSAVQSRPPLRLTPNFNGKCNIECKMCHIWQMPNGLYDELGYWEKLEKEILPHLTEIDTFSGEPFIQKDTFKLIDLAQRVNPDIVWSFTTNAQWNLTAALKKQLDGLRVKTFNVSIDSLDEDTFQEIRRKGDLQKALQTFIELKNYELERIHRGLSPLGLVFHAVIMKDNWREIPAMLKFRRQHNVKIHFNLLELPSDLSLLSLDLRSKTKILEFIVGSLAGDDLRSATRIARPLFKDLPALERAAFISQWKSKLAELI